MTPRPPFDPEKRAPRLAPWGSVLALVGAGVGGWVGVPLALAGVFLLLLACVSRRDGFLLFGPIASAELARAARLGRPWFWRSVYAVAAGLIVFFNFTSVVPGDQLFGEPRVNRNVLERVNLSISYWFAGCLFLYIGILTVQVMAGAVAEEREKKRWDALLTTDLRGREILFGKLAGRLPVVLDPLLAALPILAALPLFGGVPPWLAGTTVLACVAAMFGLGGVTLFFSVFAPTRGSAARLTGFLGGLYFLLSLGVLIAINLPEIGGFPQTLWPRFPFTVGDLLYPFVIGNPVAGLMLLARSGVDIETAAPRMAWHFALFQFSLFFMFGLTAVRRLPRAAVWGKPAADVMTGAERVKVAAKQATARDRKPTDPEPKLKPEKEPVERPPVGDWPLVWWERYGWLTKGQAGFVGNITWKVLLGVAALSLVVFGGFRVFEWLWPSENRLVRDRTDLLTVPVFLVSGFFLIPVPFRAARCVAKEREGDTMDGVLVLPLSRREVLFQKWLGVCLGDWPGFALLLAWFAPAVLTGFVSVSVAVLFVVGWFASAGVLAAFGLYFSVLSKTTGSAIFRLVLFLVALSFVASASASGARGNREPVVVAGMMPPIGYAVLMDEQRGWGPPKGPERHPDWVIAGWATGLAIYGLMGGLAWWLACRRFERDAGE